jgi:hypothetical protein
VGKLFHTSALVVVLALFSLLRQGAAAQPLVGGGLTALPPTALGPNLVANSGFETLSGGLPVGWSAPVGWGIDQIFTRAGAFSYRRTGTAGTAAQSLALRKGIYDVSAWVKVEAIEGGNAGIRLQLDLRPALNAWYTTDVIAGTRDWARYEIKNVVVPRDMSVSVKLENYAGANGTAWFDDVQVVQQLPPALDVFLLYPNYRGMLFDDGPQTLRFDVIVVPPDDDFDRYHVAGSIRDETTGAVVSTGSYGTSPGSSPSWTAPRCTTAGPTWPASRSSTRPPAPSCTPRQRTAYRACRPRREDR